MVQTSKTKKVFVTSVTMLFTMLTIQQVGACIYNDTACTCALQSGETTCLSPMESNSSLCQSYTCTNGYACDCNGSYLCAVTECSGSQRTFLPTTTLSSSNFTTCVPSEVSICTTVINEIDDPSEDSEISYNYTIVASGDYTVYSGGESLYSVAVRAPRRGGKKETTGCEALIIELEYTYDPDVGQGISFAIQETDSDTVYVSGDPDLTIRIAFNPSGDYRATDSFNFSSWVSPTNNSKLRDVGSFGEARDEFGAQPLGFDSTNDTSANAKNGTYVYYIELPFCENSRYLMPEQGSSEKPEPSQQPVEKPAMGPTNEPIDEYMYMDNEGDNMSAGIPPGFKDVTVVEKHGDLLSKEQLEELDLELDGLPSKKMKYSIVGSADFVVFILGKRARNASMMTVIQGTVDIPCVPILVEMNFESGHNISAPSISVILEMVSENDKKVFVSGSNLKIAVTNQPPSGYLNPKSDFNFSVFAPAVNLPRFKGEKGFGLLHELDDATPVGFVNIPSLDTNDVYSEENMTSGKTNGDGVAEEPNAIERSGMSGIGMRQTVSKDALSRQDMGDEHMLDTTSGGVGKSNDTAFAPSGKFVFLVHPPCANLFAFDQTGKPFEMPIDELLDFDYEMDVNKSMSDSGNPMGGDGEDMMMTTEPVPTSFDDVGFVYSEGEVDVQKLNSAGFAFAQLPTTEITFLMTASDSYKVIILGQQVESGSLRNILFGTAEVPCAPIIIESQFSPNQSMGVLPGLSLAIVGEGPESVVNVTTASTNLSILTAIDPRPGYDELISDYDYIDFKQAVPVPSISNIGGFGLMKNLTGAVPVGPLANFSFSNPISFTEEMNNTTGMNTRTPFVIKVVYIVQIPTCRSLHRFGSDGMPEQDEILNEIFGDINAMPTAIETPTPNETPEPSHESYGTHDYAGIPNGVIIGRIESAIRNHTKYRDVIVEDLDVFSEGLHSALGQQLENIPLKEAQIAIVGSNDVKIVVMGRRVLEVSKRSILPGFIDLPCSPIVVEMEFENDTGIHTPSISVVLNIKDDPGMYFSGMDLKIAVAFNPPENYGDSTSDFLFSDLMRAVRLAKPTEEDAFMLLYDMFDALPVGYAIETGNETLSKSAPMQEVGSEEKVIDVVEDDAANDNSGDSFTRQTFFNGSVEDLNAAANETMWMAPSGKYIFVIYPPCSRMYSLDKDGKLVQEVSNDNEDQTMDGGGVKPERSPGANPIDDEMTTDGFFASNASNVSETVIFADSEFDVDKIEEDLMAIGINIDELPVSEFKLELTSTEDFEVFAVGRTIEVGLKEEVLRGEVFLPCTPILVISKYSVNESIAMPVLSVAITHEMPGSEMTFVSGGSPPNKSLSIWVDLASEFELGGPDSGYNFSSLERAVEIPSLRNFSGLGYMHDTYGALPVGSLLIADLFNVHSESDSNDTVPVESPDSGSTVEHGNFFIVFVIQPPMCEALFKFDQKGMAVIDELFQNDEDLSQGFLDNGGSSNGTIGDQGSQDSMTSGGDFRSEETSASSGGIENGNTTLIGVEDNGSMSNNSLGNTQGMTLGSNNTTEMESNSAVEDDDDQEDNDDADTSGPATNAGDGGQLN